MLDTNNKTAFDRKVDDCRVHEKSDLIDNAAWGHAVYLFKNLLEVAAEKGERVRLVSGTLNNDFYGELRSKLDECIAKDVDIEVLLLDRNADTVGNDFLNKVKEYQKGHIIHASKKSISGAHMLLIGDEAKRFRLETDHTQTKAVASFNNPFMGDTLNVIYNDLKDKLEESSSTPVAV